MSKRDGGIHQAEAAAAAASPAASRTGEPGSEAFPVPPDVRRRRRRIALAVALVLAAAFLVGVRSMGRILASAPSPGKPAPDFTLPQLDGPPVRLSDLRGRVVVLNFWASWCIPCREETPALKAFYQQYGDRVAFYAINVAEPVDTVRAFLAEFGATYPVLLDRDKTVYRQYRVTGYPETFWIDEQGIVRIHWRGPMTLEDMERFYRETAAASRSSNPPPAG
ncbi:alkyl hydroperoxide reductase/ Thiol specific antioxidant/ Mal allergen [Thermaerobacter marianensis DSM 12885]|uniref:Alkyl hydroperoxide reductase/ Thiol specific antioxidant/ Mal allergen n=1 Tax=Thermaerobacter marianensis (strain ATCC 700841 / DSM 12885 / JCM 10246 / 7p75a) TaxID=644966 RepID=E6SGV2_THEM7|nr:TlpA disulfide reductase family protein [Thermaerobacter marianensis]ADU51686.1 alkyl hydroperoxide reductase/ Thiol specific antioxidant/ Mal allergen [Thermaerobacter marianensis DSM 12885]